MNRKENIDFYTPTTVIRQPDGSVIARAGKPVALSHGDYIRTTEAGRILGLSQHRVEDLCNEGKLVEGKDWWRVGERGWLRIRRAAVLAMRGIAPP